MAKMRCDYCGKPITGRSDKRFCSSSCRMRMKDNPEGAHPDHPDEGDEPTTGLAALIEAQLDEAGRLYTVEGQQALLLARQLGAKVVNTSGLASLSKEFSRVFSAAMAGVEKPKGDVVDDLSARRKALRRVHSAAV